MTINLAGCVILDKQGRILLLHRYKPEQEQWEIPGGKIENGESAEAAALREAQEELGVDVAIARFLGAAAFIDRSRTMHYSWYLANITQDPSVQETAVFDKLDYFALESLKQIVLSAGARCFVSKLDNGTIIL